MPVESELERGARMKSVGILSPSYTLLYRYMHFLENQVRYVTGKGEELGGRMFYFSTINGWIIISSLFCGAVLVFLDTQGVLAFFTHEVIWQLISQERILPY